MILNQSQAEAVYSAMCALGNVSGRVDAQMPSGRVVEGANGVILVTAYGKPSEDYGNQSAFATAYGLVHGGDKNAAALEQIARLGREGTRDGQIIRDAMTEIAEKATAYGLNSDEHQSAVAAAAGGLTQTAIES